MTDDKNSYVYLSDGGHFENLGLYEMVLRRCRFILVSDAGCDPDCTFEDLSNALRKIRVDFGVPIDFTTNPIPIYSRKKGQSVTYFAIGTIRYSSVDASEKDETILYIKPAFYGTEDPDIFNYAQANPSFPHKSTADQWFSESQFESYRRLGFYVMERVLKQMQGKETKDLPWEFLAASGN
jgi:hypothetical protein